MAVSGVALKPYKSRREWDFSGKVQETDEY
jgi:hypothetical protein